MPNKQSNGVRDEIRSDCIYLFQTAVNKLSTSSSFDLIEPINITIDSKNDSFDASIRNIGNLNRYIVEMTDGLIFGILESIENNRKKINGAIEDSTKGSEVLPTKKSEMLLDTVYELSFHFISHHEIFHYVCGHLNYDINKNINILKPRSHSESSLGLGASENKIDEEALLRAYYLEMEADSTAIEWLIEKVIFTSLQKEIVTCFDLEDNSDENFDTTIHNMDPKFRIFCFRYILVSIWIVIILMESNKDKKITSQEYSHPLPATRLLGVLSTLVLWYARIDKGEMTPSGTSTIVLTDEQRESVFEFIQSIVSPVAINLFDFQDSDIFTKIVKPISIENSAEGVAIFLQEFVRLITKQEPQTEAGKQFREIEKTGHIMKKILKAKAELKGVHYE